MTSEYDCQAAVAESLCVGYKAKEIIEIFKYPKTMQWHIGPQTTKSISSQNGRLIRCVLRCWQGGPQQKQEHVKLWMERVINGKPYVFQQDCTHKAWITQTWIFANLLYYWLPNL